METTNTDSTPKNVFQIQRLYVKEINCKAPHASTIFKENGQPVSSMELQVKQDVLEANHFEVVLQMHVTTKVNERTAYSIDIQQAGIFKLEGFVEQQLAHLLKAYCPSLLYPYLCRAVSEATTQAGFPPLLLSPINFEQLYLQQQAEASKNNDSNRPNATVTNTETASTTMM